VTAAAVAAAAADVDAAAAAAARVEVVRQSSQPVMGKASSFFEQLDSAVDTSTSASSPEAYDEPGKLD
jgi:hypothetical protein